MGKMNWKKEITKAFWVFLIGSIAGCIVETIVCLVQKGHFEFRQGLVYGPFIPVYGIGALVYSVVLREVKDWKQVFFISMILGGSVEYFCSWLQEICFGTVSWDYSNLWLNINGRTSLLHCIYWGIGGILFSRGVIPFIKKLEDYGVDNRKFEYLTNALIVFMTVNIAISCLAAQRQKERTQNINANDKIDVFLDKYYPDQVMNIVYSNKKTK